MTYTYVIMEVSAPVYNEVKKKLEDAGYHQALHEDKEDGILLDMHGIALDKQRIVDEEFETMDEAKKRIILSTIEKCDGNKHLAAEKLGLGKTTVYRLLKEWSK